MQRWNVPGISIVDVARDANIEPNKQMMWTVGLIVVNIYKQRYGALPPKDLRRKTYDEGVHCFAIYPETFRSTILKVFREYLAEEARQGELFPSQHAARQGELFPRHPPGDAHV